jgi:hypothetical protein
MKFAIYICHDSRADIPKFSFQLNDVLNVAVAGVSHKFSTELKSGDVTGNARLLFFFFCWLFPHENVV